MTNVLAFKNFTERFKLLISKNPKLITTTLSNIFTMRLIGNKTHGDLAEIAIAEFINQFMYDFRSVHVGKDLFRAKEHEANRDHAMRQDPWFDYAEGMLQIAIVLLSVSIVASVPALYWAGTVLGTLGFFSTVNGYFLLF